MEEAQYLHAKKEALITFWKHTYKFPEEIIQAFRAIKREDFVPQELRHLAYDDNPLPILRKKTISQPTTVMVMSTALEILPGQKIFEIGSGSGYQAAMAAQLTGPQGKVITTEVIPELVPYAQNNIKKAELKNISVTEEDGSKGNESEAPFDRIIITAACKEFPRELLAQLKVGGIIVGPIGTKDQQKMVKGKKLENGKLEAEILGSFLFTPMYGKYGFEI